MKKLLFLLFALLCLSGCHHRPAAQLLQADSLLSDYKVNEATKLLSRYNVEQKKKTMEDSMYYKLLCTDAQNKSYQPFTAGADSTFLPIYNYYTTKGSIFQQMRANYLMGCIYRDLGWYTEGQRYLHEAITISEKHDKHNKEENKLLSRVYGQLGDIYRYRTLIDLSIGMYNQSMSYAQKAEDSTMQYSAKLHIASCLNSKGKYRKAINELLLCYNFFNRTEPNISYSCILNIAGNYIDLKELSKANKYLIAYEKYKDIKAPNYYVKDEINNYTYYTFKGNYYQHRNMLDSAIYFYNKMCSSSNPDYRESAYDLLANCYIELGIKDSIIKYQTLYTNINGETNEKNATKQLQELQSNFSIMSEREKTYKEWISKQRVITITLSIIIILALSSIILFLLYFRKKKTYLTLLGSLKIALNNLETQKQTLIELKKKNAEMQNQIVNQAQYTLNTIESQFTDEDLIKARLEQFQSSSIVQRFYTCAEKGLKTTDKEWTELIACISKIAPAIMHFLNKNKCKISNIDFKMCLLIAVGIPPKHMKKILICTGQKLSMQRKRHLYTFFHIDGKPCEFDSLLKSLKD